MPFPTESLKKALSGLVKRVQTGLRTPGGYIGPGGTLTSPKTLLAHASAILTPLGVSPTAYESGEIKYGEVRGETFEPTGAAQLFLPRGYSTIFHPTPPATLPTRSSVLTPTPPVAPRTTTTTLAPTPVSTPTPTPAPAPASTPPSRVSAAPTPPVSVAGLGAPAPQALPPTPTSPTTLAQASTIPENLARFEAMIRALMALTRAGQLPMPTLGAEPFGPAGALERALRRLRERELARI